MPKANPEANLNGRPDYLGVSLDTRTIPQARLNIDNKSRSNLFPWNGQFSPQLVEQLLQTYAAAGDFVLDPFLGSGTVLCEAGRRGLPAYGSEINPAAFKMANIYSFINLPVTCRRRIISRVSAALSDVALDTSPLFGATRKTPPAPLHEVVIAASKEIADQHARILIEALIVLLDIGRRPLDERGLSSAWGKVAAITAELPHSEPPITLANCDARELPLAAGGADIVVTSPPYINVFNYHQQYRKSVESLGWDLLEVARSEIGSNRKNRGNRFLTVIQYCLDMVQVFAELRRVCASGARVIFVVGRESNVRKTVFYNAEIVAGLAVKCSGFEFDSRQERVFQNRFGDMIYEDILHFIASPAEGKSLEHPSVIAHDGLTTALDRAPVESQSDLRLALDKLGDVESSPIYRSQAAAVAPPARRVV